MNVIYDTEKLKKIIDDLFCLTGISMALVDIHGNYIYKRTKPQDAVCIREISDPKGRARCIADDTKLIRLAAQKGESVSHVCHAGLIDTALPIIKSGIPVGYVLVGRVVTERTAHLVDEITDTMTHITEAQHNSLKNLLSHIIFENAIKIEYDELICRAGDYIQKNLVSPLSVESICEALYVSKNKLYSSFRSYYGQTVGEYITEKRMQKAAELLRDSDLPVFLVAESVGIQNYTYFSRLFKKKNGLSPIDYRRCTKKDGVAEDGEKA